MKILITLIIVIVANSITYCQENLVRWEKTTKIHWSDFKGKVDKNSRFATMSAIGINYKYNSWSNGKVYKIKFDTFCTFDRSKSWSKVSLRSKTMLKHEQLHFDIGALVNKAFAQELKNRTYSKNYKHEIREIFTWYSKRLQFMQQKYDLRTVHGNNKFKQAEWEFLINKELLK